MQHCIYGGTGNIRDGYSCVCFSEAPIRFPNGSVNSEIYERYSPFGIMIDKKTIYEAGGRPVIYESESEYLSLPESHRWRHVRYEPLNDIPIDWTHEREWRIQCSELTFTPNQVAIIVPNREYEFRLYREHESEQGFQAYEYSLIMDEDIARQYEERFPWRITVLDEG